LEALIAQRVLLSANFDDYLNIEERGTELDEVVRASRADGLWDEGVHTRSTRMHQG
jgi:hypothetical protein